MSDFGGNAGRPAGPMIPGTTLGPQVCGDLAAGGAREWLVTDGRGGYAMGTASGLRTRRYHGLLSVPVGGAQRMLGLAALDAIVTMPAAAPVRLATHEWGSGMVAPTGHTLIEAFEVRDGLPAWLWRVGDLVIGRTLAMRHGATSVGVVYMVHSGGPIDLEVEALCTWRDAHGERHESDGLRVQPVADGFVVEDAYRVHGPGFVADAEWYHDVHHREEAARGLAATEDLLRAGRFTARLSTGDTFEISAWAGDLATVPPPPREVVRLSRQRAGDLTAGRSGDEARLVLAADAFITGSDVIAGYPWFGAWGRDTMISYEGLFLATGRPDEGRELLAAYARSVSDGMIANTADTGQLEYNTADATLWFLHAVERHVTRTGDTDLAASLVDCLDEIVRRHVEGTRYGIRTDPDGLLAQGADGYGLTWMDAVVGGVPVTPRAGKAVELNALWLNGLAAVDQLRGRLGRAPAYQGQLARGTESFRRRFPGPHGWLQDVLDGSGSLRPNQLLAYGLPYAPMRGQDPGPVQAVAHTLLTPLGLRTLATLDPAYRGRHRGDGAARDAAYHQGTVWPWLIGPYADAAAAAGLPTEGLLRGLLVHLDEWGLGSISETADGDPPHDATGCPFQAWSVAETLRTLTTHGP